jgi:hypothetical protein
MRQEFPDLRRHYRRANRPWSGSCFAGSAGGAPISVLRQYTEQNQPGQGTSEPGGPPASAFPAGLKAGALADGLVAEPFFGYRPVRRKPYAAWCWFTL